MSANRTRETTTTTGTGATITLSGALADHATFANTLTVGDTGVFYSIEEGDNYENGSGTFTASNIFTRVTVFDKKEGGVYTSSPGTPLSLLGGAEIYVGNPAEQIDDKSSLTKDNTFSGIQTIDNIANIKSSVAGEYLLSNIDKIVKSSANIVDIKVYDTTKDSDGGAWREGTQNTSWYQETLDTSTRGVTRKFPKVALIVAETDTVTIYDATDPDVPMWMVFNGSTQTIPYINVTNVTAVMMQNGLLAIATDGLCGAHFILDDLSLNQSGAFGQKRNSWVNIANRGSAGTAWLSSQNTWLGGATIINNGVNDIAITTLPGADINQSTGLPFPTIQVMTGAGSSWINPDGLLANENVVKDGTGAAVLVSGDIHPSGFCVLASATDVYVFESIPAVDTPLASADYVMNTSATTGPTITGTITSVVISSATSFEVGTSTGLFRVDYVIGTGANSVVTQITKDFNTGEQTGDIRLAALANSKTVDRSVKGNDLTENGTVTENAVATGAELKAYSGFSTSNYLERAYDADFDFGTGDFCVMGWVKKTGIQREFIFSRYSASNELFVRINDTTGYISGALGSGNSITGSMDLSDGIWHHFAYLRRSGSQELFADGSSAAAPVVNAADVDDTDAIIIVGNSGDLSRPFDEGSISLLRISAYAPTAAQIKKMYDDEKWMFRDNALATLQGTSDAVAGLSFDDDTNKLDVVTADGTTTIQGLLPVAYRDDSGVETSDNMVAVSRVNDNLALATDAEAVYVRPEREA